MEYTINKLSRMSGVSARTLRYYDEIGLLKPQSVKPNGYRVYGGKELDDLQQILFYRELGFALSDIKLMLYAHDFDKERAFSDHLEALCKKRERLDDLIHTVKRSLANFKGELTMKDSEKFKGFKQSLIDENERKYGKEIREKYGEDAVNRSNDKLAGMTEAQYNESIRINEEFEGVLRQAFISGDPGSDLAQEACRLHEQWLRIFSPVYSREYHRGLGELYLADERFKANYEKHGEGCTEFFKAAIDIYTDTPENG